MKRLLVAFVLPTALTLILAGSTQATVPCAGAGGSGDLAGVRVALHAVPYNDVKACGANAPSAFGCTVQGGSSNLVTQWPVDVRASVYAVVLDVPTAIGMKGVTFGIDYFAYNYVTYTGIFVNAFNLCMDLQFPSVSPAFPTEPGSGVVCTSNTCLGVTPDPTDPEGQGFAIVGWFDVRSYDHVGPLKITPRLYLPNPDFQVANCVAAASNPCYPEFAGELGFGGPGFDPCFIIDATEPTTWGQLKKIGSGE